jgi:hypothetical protein
MRRSAHFYFCCLAGTLATSLPRKKGEIVIIITAIFLVVRLGGKCKNTKENFQTKFVSKIGG